MQRVTISLDDDVAQAFYRLIEERGYSNRSEAVRDLVRNELARREVSDDAGSCVAVVSYAFDHHERQLSKRMAEHQHAHTHLVISTMHVHIDEKRCAEAVVMRGRLSEVKPLAEALTAETGVEHGAVNYIPLSKTSEHDHHHHHE